MTIESYMWLLLGILFLSILINIFLLIRLDMLNNFIRYTNYVIAILRIHLEILKNEHKSTKSSE